MDSSPFLWLAEMGLNNSNFTDESDFMDSFDEQLAAALRQDLEDCLSQGNNSSSISSPSSTLINDILRSDSISSLPTTELTNYDHPPNIQKPNNPSNIPLVDQRFINYGPGVMSSVPIVLNFENAESLENPQQENSRVLNPQEEAAIAEVLKTQGQGKNLNEQSNPTQTTVKKPSRIRPPQQTYDHIIAERKRRELLSQRFVALSTIVPGLKKKDKTSVLGDAIKYLKHLQERVKTLEEQAAKQTMESVVLVKRLRIMLDEDDGSSDENNSVSYDQPLPEIEARMCDENMLIRVHCEKKKGTLVNLLNTVEMLNLSIVTSNLAQFGSNLALDITIIAKMEKGFTLTVKELVRKLRDAIRPTVDRYP